MRKIVAIDFGTHDCSMAVHAGDGVHVIEDERGESSIPSVVAVTSKGVLVGRDAEAHGAQAPECSIHGVKRLLGQKFHSPEVQWLAQSYPYPVVAAPNGDAHIHIHGRDYSPEELASFLLEHLMRVAQRFLGEPADAVITVPGWYGELSRRALLNAAKLAGVRVKTLMSATSAAALMCRAEGSAQRVALIDAGAGGFEAAIATSGPSATRILASSGDPMLGGDDFDQRLMMRWLQDHQTRTREDISTDPFVLRFLRLRAQHVKHELSTRSRVEAAEETIVASGRRIQLALPAMTRDELADLLIDDLGRMLDPCRWAFDDAQLGMNDVDAVFVVGGLARMPAVQESIDVLFRRSPRMLGNADHIVALGAARYSAGAGGHGERHELREAIGCSTGLRIAGGKFSPVVRRNQPIPCKASQVFRTAHQGQDRIVFDVFQGECETAADNLYVGRFTLDGLHGHRAVETSFRIDKSGLLHIALLDPRTGIGRDLPLALAGGLGDRELVQLRQARDERQRLPHDAPPTPPPLRTPAPLSPPTEPSPRTRPPQIIPFTDPGVALARSTIEMDADALVGTVLHDRYVIEAVLGEGGMGRIYRGRHKVLNKPFAIKVLHPELAQHRVLAQRFIEEARAASSIKSPHVIDISDFGRLDDGAGYFVMEYLDGRTLRQRLDQGTLDVPTMLSISHQIATGLEAAHKLGVVHRDLKPDNIMLVEREDGSLRCVILDFGIAKRPTSSHSGSAVTRSGVRVGTPEYMTPEQIDGRDVDARTDVYALGIMMYEMLAGRRPFDAESVAETLANQLYHPPPSLAAIGVAVGEDLESVIRTCMEKDPDQRFASAGALVRVLARLAQDPLG